MLHALVAVPAARAGAFLVQVAAEYAAGAGTAAGGTGYDGAIRGVTMTEVRQIWDANVPFPPWMAAAGVATLWLAFRTGRPRAVTTASDAPVGGISNGFVLVVGLIVLYVLARMGQLL